jgi:hypothetical protein
MFSLSVSFGPTPIVWRLLFKTSEAAESAWATTQNPGFTINDDFGQRVHVTHAAYAVMLENLDESKIGFAEFSIHQARSHASVQSRVQADPMARAAAVNGGLPMHSQMLR